MKYLNWRLNLQHRKHDHEQARPFHLASELSQRTTVAGNGARDRAQKGERIFAEISAAIKMTMARFHVVAIAAGLLLAVSEPSFAAKRTLQKSDTKSTVKSQSRAIKSNGAARTILKAKLSRIGTLTARNLNPLRIRASYTGSPHSIIARAAEKACEEAHSRRCIDTGRPAFGRATPVQYLRPPGTVSEDQAKLNQERVVQEILKHRDSSNVVMITHDLNIADVVLEDTVPMGEFSVLQTKGTYGFDVLGKIQLERR